MNTTRKNGLLRTSALTAVALATGALLAFGTPESPRAATPLSPSAGGIVQAMPNFADMTEAVAPAVVNIQVTQRASQQTARSDVAPPELPEGLKRFFGDGFAELWKGDISHDRCVCSWCGVSDACRVVPGW